VGCTAEELDTSELIAGERNERSTNLVRGDPQKHLMLSMTLAQRAEVVWHKILFIYNSNSHESQSTNHEDKTYPINPNSSQAPSSQDAPPSPALLLNRPPPLPSSPQFHDAPTACAPWVASCPRSALMESRICRSLIW
jgi:hypothetical protein